MNGCLVKRGKYYHARYWYKGKEYKKTTGKTNRPEAQKELERIIAPLNAELSAGAHLDAVKLLITEESELRGLATPLAELWEKFETAPERNDCSPRSLNDYHGAVRKLLTWCSDQKPPLTTLNQVTTFTARQYAKYLSRAVGDNTYNKHIGILRLVWKITAFSTGWEVNPWQNIRRKQFEVVNKRELTLDERGRLLNAAEGEFKTLITLGIYTGQRRKDLCLLQWKDVHTSRRLIMIKPYKTARRKNKLVHIPIHRDLLPLLTIRPAGQRYVLPEIAKLYTLKEKQLTGKIAEIFNAAGITRQAAETPDTHRRRPITAGFHSLRHSFVSICREDDMPMAVAQSIVGHSNPEMTRHYTHVGAKALLKEMDSVHSFTADSQPPD